MISSKKQDLTNPSGMVAFSAKKARVRSEIGKQDQRSWKFVDLIASNNVDAVVVEAQF
jgi:hypothetical protein